MKKIYMLMAAMIYKWLLVSGLWFLANPSPFPENPAPADDLKHFQAAHPFYVSVTEINHNAAEKTLEVSCKVFAEDIEEILEKNYNTTLDISVEKDQPNFDKLLPDYFGKHFSLSVDGKPTVLSYVGFELDKESVYCYFQVIQVAALKKLDVNNSILYDFNENQINIMHTTVNGKRQSTKLDYPDKSAGFIF